MVTDMAMIVSVTEVVCDGEPPGLQPRRRNPKTGAERMREFRRRHPDFDRKRHARMRAALALCKAVREAEKAAALEAMLARQKTVLMLPAPAPRLMLPAPVVDPTMAAINEVAMKRNRQRVAA